MRLRVPVALTLLLAGCASTVETVDRRMLLQPGTETYELDPLELFVMPMALDAPLPTFPDDSGEANGSVVACAEVWISATGDIARVSALHDAPGCPGGDDAVAAFERAVLASMRNWSFSPAMICRFRPDQRDKRERGDCRGDVEVQRVPVRLAYAFEFQRRGGRVAVAPRRLPSD